MSSNSWRSSVFYLSLVATSSSWSQALEVDESSSWIPNFTVESADGAAVPGHLHAETIIREQRRVARIAEIEPEFVLNYESGGTLFIRGGRLGRIDATNTTDRDIARALVSLSSISFATEALTVRVTATRDRPYGKRLEFEQTINDIPVARNNIVRLDSEGNILEIDTQLVDPDRARKEPTISEAAALRAAMKALADQVGLAEQNPKITSSLYLYYPAYHYEDRLTPFYRVDLQSADLSVWRVLINAHTASTEIIDPSMPHDVFGYQVCRDNSTTQDPLNCSLPGAQIIWNSPPEIAPGSCPFSDPMGGPSLCTNSDYGRSHSAMINANRALLDIDNANPEYCCDLIGGPDRILHIIPRTSGRLGVATYYHPSEAIMSAAGDPALRSMETVSHEFAHHVFTVYNPEVASLYGTAGNDFVTIFMESYADVMQAAFALAYPVQPNIFFEDPWKYGDGLDGTTLRNLADPGMAFGYLLNPVASNHEKSRAISRYFHRLYTESGMTKRRLLELLLSVGDQIRDYDGNGLDLLDLENALNVAVGSNETALRSHVNGIFDQMYQSLPGSASTPLGPGMPMPQGAPGTPTLSASFFECGIHPTNGQGTSRWLLSWNAISNTTHYTIWLKGEFQPHVGQQGITSETSAMVGIWGTNFAGNARAYGTVAACNLNGCGRPSNWVTIQMLTACLIP